METSYRYVDFEIEEGVATISLKQNRLTEHEVIELSREILQMANDHDCPRVILDFENKNPQCLFSVFLAKLVGIQKQLEQMGGGLRLCHCNKYVMEIFDACRLSTIFDLRTECENPTEGW